MERLHSKTGREGILDHLLILMLSKKPYSGYDIAKEMTETTHGMCKPTPGGLYPALHKLENKGIIKGKKTGERGRVIYSLTEEGKKLVKELRKHIIEEHLHSDTRTAVESLIWSDEPDEIRKEIIKFRKAFFELRVPGKNKYTKKNSEMIARKIREMTREIEKLNKKLK